MEEDSEGSFGGCRNDSVPEDSKLVDAIVTGDVQRH
jgi:hypothetical protein